MSPCANSAPLPSNPALIPWSIRDAAHAAVTDDESYPAFVCTADELAAHVSFLVELIEHNLFTKEVSDR